MPKLLSGSTLRRGGSGEFIDLKGAMPQLPPTDSTETGFTLVTDPLFRTSYKSSLGKIEFIDSSIYSQNVDGVINILATGTSFYSISVDTGNLVVEGGIGVGGNMHIEDDITVNELLIGKGWEGKNNIVIQGVAQTEDDEETTGQSTIAIGYNTLKGIEFVYKNIAIGNYALSSGTRISKNIAIGHSSLRELGVTPYHFNGTITNITFTSSQVITNITNANPAVVTVIDHNLSNGDRVYVNNVNGLTTSTYSPPFHLVNDRSFYVNVLTTDTFEIFLDKDLTIELDSISASSYISSGTIQTPIFLTIPNHVVSTASLVIMQNILGTIELNGHSYYADVINTSTVALYSDVLLTQPISPDGYTPYISSGTISRVLSVNNNIAIGIESGKSLIDGGRNFFIGDEIAKNLTTGSNNFFLGHQVANNVITGSGIISIGGDNIVNGKDNQINIGSVFYFDGDGYASLNAETTLGLGSDSTGTDTGALTVIGGAGIAGNAYIGGIINVLGTLTNQITSSVESTSTETGALVIDGGVGIGKDLWVGGFIHGQIFGASSTATNLAGGATGSIPYQSGVGQTAFIPIGNNGFVLTSNGTTATWTAAGSLAAATATDALHVAVEDFDNTTSTYYMGFTDLIGGFSVIRSNTALVYNTSTGYLTIPALIITNTASSTSTVTSQAITIDGGLGVRKNVFVEQSVYSAEGIADEGYLLYTPRTTVASSAPSTPRIGDFWVKVSNGNLYQYIKDGTSTFWLQVTV